MKNHIFGIFIIMPITKRENKIKNKKRAKRTKMEKSRHLLTCPSCLWNCHFMNERDKLDEKRLRLYNNYIYGLNDNAKACSFRRICLCCFLSQQSLKPWCDFLSFRHVYHPVQFRSPNLIRFAFSPQFWKWLSHEFKTCVAVTSYSPHYLATVSFVW